MVSLSAVWVSIYLKALHGVPWDHHSEAWHFTVFLWQRLQTLPNQSILGEKVREGKRDAGWDIIIMGQSQEGTGRNFLNAQSTLMQRSCLKFTHAHNKSQAWKTEGLNAWTLYQSLLHVSTFRKKLDSTNHWKSLQLEETDLVKSIKQSSFYIFWEQIMRKSTFLCILIHVWRASVLMVF